MNRFGVTRALTQQLLLQELCEQNPDSKQKLQEYISKLMNNNKPNNGLVDSDSNPQLDSERKGASPSLGGGSSLAALSPGNHSQASPLSASPVSTTPSGGPGGGPLIPPPHSTISPVLQMNGGGATSSLPPPSPTSSMTSPSPLNKLQSMHPFDYPKLEHAHAAQAQRKTPEMPRSSSSSIEKPLPPSLSPMRFPPPPSHGLGPPGYPMPPNFGLHHPGKDT